MEHGRRFVAALLATALVGVPAPTRAETGEPAETPRAVFALDAPGRTLTAIDPARGEPFWRAPLDKEAERVFASADGSRLIVLYHAPGSLEEPMYQYARGNPDRYRFHPSARSRADILDAGSGRLLGRLALGFGMQRFSLSEDRSQARWELDGLMFSPDGQRLTVLSPGKWFGEPTERRPAEVTSIDLVAGAVLARVRLPRRAEWFQLTPDGGTLLALVGREVPDPPRLHFIELHPLKQAASLDLAGEPREATLAADGRFLYYLSDDKTVRAVAIGERVDRGPLALGFTPKRLLAEASGARVLALGSGSGKTGRIGALRDGAVGESATVASEPSGLRFDRDRLLVFGKEASTLLDAASLAVRGPLPIRNEDGKQIKALSFNADGKRLSVLYGDQLEAVDLEQGRVVASLKLSGSALGKIAAAVVLTALAVGMGAVAGAVNPMATSLMPTPDYQAIFRKTAAQMVADAEGRRLYALYEGRVMVIDAETLAVIQKLELTGEALEMAPAGDVVRVLSRNAITLLDTATHAPRATLEGQSLVLSPDGSQLFYATKEGVAVADGDTGAARASLGGFHSPGAFALGGALPPGLWDDDSPERRNARLALWDSLPSARTSAVQPLAAEGSRLSQRALRVAGLDAEEGVRRASLAALLKQPPAVDDVPVLVRALGDSDTRAAAREALVKLGEPAVRALLAEVEAEESVGRGLAVEMLGSIGPAAQAAVPLLVEKLRESGLRGEATGALVSIGAAAVPAIVRASPPDPDFDKAAVKVLLGIGAPAVEALVVELGSDNAAYQSSAIGWLTRIGSAASAAVPALNGLANHPNAVIRRQAAKAVEKISGS